MILETDYYNPESVINLDLDEDMFDEELECVDLKELDLITIKQEDTWIL